MVKYKYYLNSSLYGSCLLFLLSINSNTINHINSAEIKQAKRTKNEVQRYMVFTHFQYFTISIKQSPTEPNAIIAVANFFRLVEPEIMNVTYLIIIIVLSVYAFTFAFRVVFFMPRSEESIEWLLKTIKSPLLLILNLILIFGILCYSYHWFS